MMSRGNRPIPKPSPLYIFDLDGTLADAQHRVPLFYDESDPEHHQFHAQCHLDTPIEPIIQTMKLLLKSGSEIWILTARSDEVRQLTMEWLMKNTDLSHEHLQAKLFMQSELDKRSNEEFKEKFLQQMTEIDRQRLIGVFEDRQVVVDMWRRNGVQCFQVASGEF